jgi:hypothetical protein
VAHWLRRWSSDRDAAGYDVNAGRVVCDPQSDRAAARQHNVGEVGFRAVGAAAVGFGIIAAGNGDAACCYGAPSVICRPGLRFQFQPKMLLLLGSTALVTVRRLLGSLIVGVPEPVSVVIVNVLGLSVHSNVARRKG